MELLRLLASTRQTGTLQVLADGPMLVTLVDGAVSYASADPKRTLLDVLRAEGLLDRATWEAAVRAGDRDLGEALAEAGVDDVAVIAVVRRVIVDTVVDLVLVETGRFRFASGQRHSIGERFLYPVSELDADVAQRLEAWELDRPLIPSFAAVPRLAPRLPEGSPAVTIAAADWQTIAAIDGRRSLTELREALVMTRLSLGHSVATLVRSGVVELGRPS